jgi:hypothetical protein
MTEKQRLVKAEQRAVLLVLDLRNILTQTDNLHLEKLTTEAIEQVEAIRYRLRRFADKQ